MNLPISPLNINTPDNWEIYMNTNWLKNNGRDQTRLFAHYFLEKIILPDDIRTILDVGCAFGDALPVFHKKYPRLKLTGCDVSHYAIQEAQNSYGEFAEFKNWSFNEIQGNYDAIYCSNVLEHFENYLDIAKKLVNHCNYCYIMTPYRELLEGNPLSVSINQWHVVTFDKNSFKDIRNKNIIRKHIIYTPFAWGKKYSLKEKIDYLIRNHDILHEEKQIIYEIIPKKRKK